MEQFNKKDDMLFQTAYKKSLWKKPNLQHLFFELTDKCNLRCRHCGSNCTGERNTFLSLETIEKTMKSVSERYPANRIMINLTGGEPMLYPDIYDVIRMARDFGFRAGMTSNGTLINYLAAHRLVEAGLDTIAISLDGIGKVHDSFRRTDGSYLSAVLGINALKHAGLEPEVITVIHKKNLFQLEEMYELLRNMDIYAWRVVNIEPIGRASANRDLLLDESELRQLFDFICEKRRLNDNTMSISYACSHFVTFEYEKEIRDFYFRCGAGTTVGSIMANGDIGACLDIVRKPELIQGNVYQDDFVYIWENKFEVFRMDRSNQCNLCKQCGYKNFCMGDSAHTWDFDKQEPLYCAAQILKGVENVNKFTGNS